MIRFKAILVRVMKEIIKDKRTLALMFLAPILLLTLLNYIFISNDDAKVNIGVNETVPTAIIQDFPKEKIKVKEYKQEVDQKKVIEEHHLAAFIEKKGNTFYITYQNENPSDTMIVKSALEGILVQHKMEQMAVQLKQMSGASGQKEMTAKETVKSSYLYGNADSTFFDKIFPILVGFFIFFFVFLISGIALLKERTGGTLERLLSTPVRRSELILGYSVGYGIFAILQTLLIVLYAIYILQLDIAGNIGWVVCISIFIALTALEMGIFISTFANSEFQMVQFIPVVIIPQIFFSGLIPLDTMAAWLKSIGYILPLTYGGEALTNVVIKGQGFKYIWGDLLILLLFTLFFMSINIIGLKRYRKV